MIKYTINSNTYDETNIDRSMVTRLIDTHYANVYRIVRTHQYYNGNHDILNRTKRFKGSSNEKLVCNHARDIVLTSTGYFLNNPIQYLPYDDEYEEVADTIQEKLDNMNSDDIDSDLADEAAISGVAYEYIYAKEDESELTSRVLDNDKAFMVYDDTIEENLLFGVYYYRYEDVVLHSYCYRATVCTENLIYEFILECNDGKHQETLSCEPHNLGNVPIIEYLNNRDGIGDFEQQISLIDAYNTLMSDRVNDKVQFVESLLVIYGSNMGDDGEEVSQAMSVLKEHGLLEMPIDAKAEYIQKSFKENELEVLRKAIKEDIYTFSHVPNLTDEAFGGNVSGVAMEYKLLGLNQITKKKQRYFIKGLKRRIQLICNYYNIKGQNLNPNQIKYQFTRELPKNMQELASMIATLKGTVSNVTLVSQLPFIEDARGEVERVKEENKEALEQQQQMFSMDYNTPFNRSNNPKDEEPSKPKEETEDDE